LSNEENHELLSQKLEENLTGLLNHTLGDAEKSLTAVLPEDWVARVAGGLKGAAPDIAVYLDGQLDAFVHGGELYKKLNDIAPRVEEKLGEWIVQAIRGAWYKYKEMKAGEVIRLIGADRIESAKKYIMRGVNTAVAKGAVFVAENMDVPGMVRDKMNAFEIEEAEEIILSVVSRELKAITVLGGVLGFVIGFVPALVNLL
jgi:hypothetical protein